MSRPRSRCPVAQAGKEVIPLKEGNKEGNSFWFAHQGAADRHCGEGLEEGGDPDRSRFCADESAPRKQKTR